jgi:hypothetical protein
LDKVLLLPFVLLFRPPFPSSFSSGMRNLDGWMTRRMMGRMDGKDDRIDKHLKYYIYRLGVWMRHVCLMQWFKILKLNGNILLNLKFVYK